MDKEKLEKAYNTLNVEDTYHIKDSKIDYNISNENQYTFRIDIKSKLLNGTRECQSNLDELVSSVEFIEALYDIADIKHLKLKINEQKYYMTYKNKIKDQEVSLDFLSSDHDMRFAKYISIADIMDRSDIGYDLKLCSYIDHEVDNHTMALNNGYMLHVSKDGKEDYIFQKLDNAIYMINIDKEHDMETDLLVIKDRLPMINTINEIAGQTYMSAVEIDLSYENPLITIYGFSNDKTQIYASKLLEEYKVNDNLIKFIGSNYYNGHISHIYNKLLSMKENIHDNILEYQNYIVEFKNNIYHISYQFSDKIRILINEKNLTSIFIDMQNIDKYIQSHNRELKNVNRNIKGNLVILPGFKNIYVLNGKQISQDNYNKLTKFSLFSK